MTSLFCSVSWPRGRKPRRARLLERLESLLPWASLEQMISPNYPRPETGRPPYPLAVMVRVFVLQWLFDLSDESAEDLILDSHSAAAFVGLDPWKPRPPGASAIGRFRLLVEAHENDAFRFEIGLALLGAKAELRLGRIIEPRLKIKPGGVPPGNEK
jgi:IS5 family transposase